MGNYFEFWTECQLIQLITVDLSYKSPIKKRRKKPHSSHKTHLKNVCILSASEQMTTPPLCCICSGIERCLFEKFPTKGNKSYRIFFQEESVVVTLGRETDLSSLWPREPSMLKQSFCQTSQSLTSDDSLVLVTDYGTV